MKKADITDAASQHDSVAIFEHQRGERYGDVTYVRLMTEADRQAHGQPSSDGGTSKFGSRNARISVVFVEPVNEKGERLSRYRQDDFVCASFVDTEAVRLSGQPAGRPLMFTVPIQRLKRQVNATQSFAEFFNGHLAARKAAAEQREQAEKEKARRQRAHEDRLLNMSERLRELGHAKSRVENAHFYTTDKVEIDIDTLSALIAQAEKAGA
ncbi:MAG: hypothetical protein EBR82_73825 [Caulobacteraceae bacterium]|nr:hypothetical protein [Caulobacteraceae bacterium]